MPESTNPARFVPLQMLILIFGSSLLWTTGDELDQHYHHAAFFGPLAGLMCFALALLWYRHLRHLGLLEPLFTLRRHRRRVQASSELE